MILDSNSMIVNTNNNNNNINSIYKISLAINDRLIKTVMIYDGLGLGLPLPFSYFPRFGESLHLHGYEISSVEAFVHVENKNKTLFSRVLSLLRLQSAYLPIGSVYEPRKLPAWLDYKVRKDVLVLSGIPTSDEKKEVLIRVFDHRRFIVKQFQITIVDEQAL